MPIKTHTEMYTINNNDVYCLLLGLAGILDPLKEKIHTELAQKLTATDSLMKENINKLLRSRVC